MNDPSSLDLSHLSSVGTLDALRESESRFRTLAECAPVVVWMSDASNGTIYISPYWREFTGRNPDDDLGFKWVEAIHPSDRDRAARDFLEAAADRRPCRGEYRILRANGKYGWLGEYGVPYFHADGSYAGYIGTCMDITDSKEREHRVQSGLLLGQESERKRVARELHDDISQRIALVVATLGEIEQLSSANPALADRLAAVQREVNSVADDLRQISHNLHPSTVAHFGLMTAVRRLCLDFSKQMHIAVDFEGDDTLPQISEETALALYRVTQECLSNIARHSGCHSARVSLTGRCGTIHLRIADSGVGFDVGRLPAVAGLGLTSIQERARVIAADLEIQSAASRGTVIELRVPAAQNRG